ncbi:MAG: hypothetical protein ABIO39_14255 [Caulobacteraceae bacterium]
MRVLALALALAGAGQAAAPLKPPSADPREITGVWWTKGYDRTYRTLDGQLPPFTPAGRAEWERHVQAEKDGRPIADAPTRCLPHGVPRLMASPYPIQILQTPGQITFLHEVAHNVRIIHMDEAHPANLDPNYLGHSVGHWEGDTLVVDTVGLNDKTQIDEEGITHSDRLHVVERFRKINSGAALEDLITMEDPVTFVRPWTARRVYEWRPDTRIMEYVCEENNRNEVDATGAVLAR